MRKTPRRRASGPQGWNLGTPDQVIEMPRGFDVPAKGAVEYQYFAAPTGFTEDRWVQGVEVRPGNRAVVHHVVVYIREPGSTWTGGPTKSDILTVYAPGSSPDVWPQGMAKRVKAGSDLVFEIHYTPNGKATTDRERVGLVFAKSPPEKAVLTLQMGNDTFTIPAGERDYRVMVGGTLPNDALLLGFFPHMHLRGKAFEYTRIARQRAAGDAAEGEPLRFLLADDLPPGDSAGAEEGDAAWSGWRGSITRRIIRGTRTRRPRCGTGSRAGTR